MHPLLLVHPNQLRNCIFQEADTDLVRAVPKSLKKDQTPSIIVSIPPRWGAVGGDDTLAALEGLGYDKPEIVGEGRENKHIAPIPNLLLLLAKGIGHNFQLWGDGERGMGGRRDLPYSFFKKLQPLQRMLAAKVE